MHVFPKTLIAAAAAAFLAISPAYAQSGTGSGTGTGTGGGSSEIAAPTDLNSRATPELRTRMGETFRTLTLPEAIEASAEFEVGAAVPETVVLHPVPDEIVTVVPESRGYQYYTLSDGRIALVHPTDRTIAMYID